MHTKTRRLSIFRTLFIAQALLIALVMLVSMFISQYYYSSSTVEQSLTESRELISMIGLNFSNYFVEARVAAHQIATNESAKMLCRSYGDMDWKQRLPRVRELESLLAHTSLLKNYMYSIAVIGQQGFSCVSSSEAAYSYETLAALPYVKPYLHDSDMSARYLSLHSYDYLPKLRIPYVVRRQIVSVIAPIIVDARAIGCVIIDLDYRRMYDIFSLLNKNRGRDAYMIDDQGKYLFHSDPNMDGAPVDAVFLSHLTGTTGSFMLGEDENIHTLFYRDDMTGWYTIIETDYNYLMRYADRAQFNTWIILVLGVLMGLFVSYLIARSIRRPLNRLTQRMDIVEQSDFKPVPVMDFYFHELNRINSHFEHMVQRINQLIEDKYIANARQKDAAFKALQAQVTPHFLQNTLQMIKSEVVLGRTAEAGRIITVLGRLLNYSMHNSQELSSIHKELEYSGNYLEIFKKRLDGRIDYSIRIEEALSELMMPRMSLQPLIENSIKHGGQQATVDDPLFIRIYGRQQNGEMLISVYDNGHGMPPEYLEQLQRKLEKPEEFAEENIGLINTHLRMRHCYGAQYGLSVQSEEGMYTQITLHFPAMSADVDGEVTGE